MSFAAAAMEGTAEAVVTEMTGSRDGLTSEVRYVLTLARWVLRCKTTGKIRRAAAICGGLAITASAYGRARLARAMARGNPNGLPRSRCL